MSEQRCDEQTRKNIYAGVYILSSPYKIDKEYEYFVPEKFREYIKRGCIATVPFGMGNSIKTAVVSSLYDTPKFDKAKQLNWVQRDGVFLKDDLLDLCMYIKEMCICTVGEAVKTVMPAGISIKTDEYFEIKKDTVISGKTYDSLNQDACEIVEYIKRNSKVSSFDLTKNFGSGAKVCANSLCRLGILEKHSDTNMHINEKTVRYLKLKIDHCKLDECLSEQNKKITPKQKNVLRVLQNCNSICSVSEVLKLANAGASVVKELIKKGCAEYVDIGQYRNPYDFENMPKSEDFCLSDEQNDAFCKLLDLYNSRTAKAALLFGITGSGKTNVILKLTDRVVAENKKVIFLVPEIALTSQNIAVFAGRYPGRIAIIHSALSAGEKIDTWKRINEGKADVIIGTRSAVFAPVDNLGLIVIDEEQETSFKSDMKPKYHARDIARFRCAKNNCLMLLSSATPSIESYYKAECGAYTLIKLKKRFGNACLPKVYIYDMKSEAAYTDAEKSAKPKMIGKVLHDELQKNLEDSMQSILFVNRRGYHAFVNCRNCGGVASCPNCSVSLTYHRKSTGEGYLMCHYCGYTVPDFKTCTLCGSDKIAYMGFGTQLLEEELKSFYPTARILRMDTDSTGGKLSHEKILSSFRNNEADILVGTQMVTKGHDFKNVTLVGVIMADTSLYINDFRANEKTFSLITQVLGRAGRGNHSGRAVIQTYRPDNEILQLASSQNYEKFYDGEIKLRKASVFPPFCDIVCINFSSPVKADAINTSKLFGEKLSTYAKSEFKDVSLIVYGPFQAPIFKLQGQYRIRYIIKCKNTRRTRQFLQTMYSDFSGLPEDVLVTIDINPVSL